jgi:uracil-DNA glycosylase
MERLWRDFLEKDSNLELLNSILDTIDNSGQKIQPDKVDVLKIFRMLAPDDIKVVIVAQSPYETSDAGGIPFVSKRGNIPKTLEVLKNEVENIYGCRIYDPNKMIYRWIKQGVFLLNSSLTIGVDDHIPRYLRDHFDLWHEFIAKVLEYICTKDIPVILMGSVAWKYAVHIASSPIKTPHPVSRGDKKFSGEESFAKITFIDWK